VDTAYLHGRDPVAVAESLCEGGADLIQLRAKQTSPNEVQPIAAELRLITEKANVGLVINDHLSIATAVRADFCHLGQEDFFDAGFRHISDLSSAGTGLRIGLSTHSPSQAGAALNAGADYIAIGPVYPTGTKPTAKAVTLDYVKWAAAHVNVPWFAIGGINLENLDDVLAAGAQRICVVSAILNAPDPAKACAAFRARLQ
jgi:thiamine-phosphate pyrophosphorylase